jgi:hypothetical protein
MGDHVRQSPVYAPPTRTSDEIPEMNGLLTSSMDLFRRAAKLENKRP